VLTGEKLFGGGEAIPSGTGDIEQLRRMEISAVLMRESVRIYKSTGKRI
jgi:hypothetical protein